MENDGGSLSSQLWRGLAVVAACGLIAVVGFYLLLYLAWSTSGHEVALEDVADDTELSAVVDDEASATTAAAVAEDSVVLEVAPPVELPGESLVRPDLDAVDRPAEGMFTPVSQRLDSVARFNDGLLGLGAPDGRSLPLVWSSDGVVWIPASNAVDAELDLAEDDVVERSFSDLFVEPDGSLRLYMSEARPGDGSAANSYLNHENRWLRSTDGEFWEIDDRFGPIAGDARRWRVDSVVPGGYFISSLSERSRLKDGVDIDSLTAQCRNAAEQFVYEFHSADRSDFVEIPTDRRLSGFVLLEDGRIAWLEAGAVHPGVEQNCRGVLELPEPGPIYMNVLEPDSGMRTEIALRPDQVTLEGRHQSTVVHMSTMGTAIRVVFDNAVWEVDADGGGWEQLLALPDFKEFGYRTLLNDGERVAIFADDALYVADLWTGSWERYDAGQALATDPKFPIFIDDESAILSTAFDQVYIDLPER